MIPSRLIEAKRDGREIGEADLDEFLRSFLADELPDYQMSAFLMAVVFRGLTSREQDQMVRTMLESGETLSWEALPHPTADKHSTGGVGDKVSLILAPLAAELGLMVPMMSGRGLGHSGGTLDKLESIPGFRTGMPLEEFRAVLETVGCAMIGQTEEIAPLDKRLYGLRNVTGTVSAVPLIASSIMSKKLAEGLDALVLDVKTGSGAFLESLDEALVLARTMVDIGERYGVRTTALLTAMDRPLGVAAGNALEVAEAVEVLRGGGPPDVREVSIRLTAEMLVSAGVAGSASVAEASCAEALDSGAAFERFARLVEAQGGDPGSIRDPAGLPTASEISEVRARRGGIVRSVSPRRLGWAVVELGGGRRRLEDRIDPSVGLEVLVRPGQPIASGDALAVVHASDESGLRGGEQAVLEAVEIGDEHGPAVHPLVSHRVSAAGIEVLSDRASGMA